MSIGDAFAQRVLNDNLNSGCSISLHSAHPGRNGAGQVGKAFRVSPNVFSISTREARNNVPLVLGKADAGGSVTHWGIRNQFNEWIIGGPLRERRTLSAGIEVSVDRGEILVRFA